MNLKYIKIVILGLILTISGASNAALIMQGGTGSGGAGNIILSGSGSTIDVAHGSYFSGVTTPASGWIWDTANSDGVANPLQFTFSFSLAGFDLSTATLAGFWGVDNVGTVKLNGILLSDLPNVIVGNFTQLHAFSAGPGSSAFLAGLNVLSFDVGNRGGPGAFRASVEVNAEPANIPAPGLLGLFLLSLAVVARTRMTAKKA